MERQIAEIIADEQNLDMEDFEQRKRFLMIGDTDVARIKAFGRSLPQLPESMFDFFYEHLSNFAETKKLLEDSDVVARLKKKQIGYFRKLLEGNYDWDYMLSRLAVGYVHVEMGVVPLWYVGAFGKYLEQIKKLTEQYALAPQATYESLFKGLLAGLGAAEHNPARVEAGAGGVEDLPQIIQGAYVQEPVVNEYRVEFLF